MVQTESPKWAAIQYYIESGLSIIPVREREERKNDRTFPAKTPIGRWKLFQQKRMLEGEAWDKFMDNDIAQPAIVAGMVSGNLEVIDIDEKHWPGISATYLTQIQKLRPELYSCLRIHRTPSNGFHIIYRCEEVLDCGNQKLATRKDGKEAGIETRGEGGYIVAPPTMGYDVIQNVHIPVLSLSDRDFLINVAKCYDERVVVAAITELPKRDSSIYNENPFMDYDNSNEGENVLLQFGWKIDSQDSVYVHYTRPDKDKGVSASFIKARRCFYIFTTSTGLIAGKGYKPATALSILQFNDDKKATFQHLVSLGFGKIKKEAESRIVKSSAMKGAALPANISDEGKKLYETVISQLNEKYPFGIFWEGDFLEGFSISRERLYSVAASKGFYLFGEQICFIELHRIHKVTDRFFFDSLKNYINEDHPKEQENICNAYEGFIQRSGKFTISRLPILNQNLILKSSKTISYKFYENGFLTVTKDGYVLQNYNALAGFLIWADQIKSRQFEGVDWSKLKTGLYYNFIDKAIGVENNNRHVLKCIGYLTHDFKDEEMGYIMVLTESVANPKDGGGSGKNIFGAMLGRSSTFKEVPGSQVQMNEKLMQTWNGERIFALSDVPKRFDYSFLKNLSSNDAVVKKLFKDEVTIASGDMPKFIVSTNFSYEVSDGGLQRRIIPIEFTNFFTKSGGVKKHFGKMFPADFNSEDWACYDNIIAASIYEWLNAMELNSPELTETGWRKQFDINYGETTRLFIEEYWTNWIKSGKVTVKEFNQKYDTHLHDNGTNSKFKLSSYKMNSALSEWSKKHETFFEPSRNLTIHGITDKYKIFSEQAPF